jgi:hypothetical protein
MVLFRSTMKGAANRLPIQRGGIDFELVAEAIERRPPINKKAHKRPQPRA